MFGLPRYSKTHLNQTLYRISQEEYHKEPFKLPDIDAHRPIESEGLHQPTLRNSHTYSLHNTPFPCTSCGLKFSNFQSRVWHESTCKSRQPVQFTSILDNEIDRIRSINFDEDRRPLPQLANKYVALPKRRNAFRAAYRSVNPYNSAFYVENALHLPSIDSLRVRFFFLLSLH
jgi:hypothetical protein